MTDAKRPKRLEIAAVIAQLIHLGMETNQRSLFEHRRLLEQALDLIRRLRANELGILSLMASKVLFQNSNMPTGPWPPWQIMRSV